MTQTQKDRDMLREWAVFYEAGLRRQNSDVNLTQAQIAKDRARLEADPIEWIKFFFEEYCKFEFADFQVKAIRRCLKHEEWFEVLSWLWIGCQLDLHRCICGVSFVYRCLN